MLSEIGIKSESPLVVLAELGRLYLIINADNYLIDDDYSIKNW